LTPAPPANCGEAAVWIAGALQHSSEEGKRFWNGRSGFFGRPLRTLEAMNHSKIRKQQTATRSLPIGQVSNPSPPILEDSWSVNMSKSPKTQEKWG
jgi:hypothetical protein